MSATIGIAEYRCRRCEKTFHATRVASMSTMVDAAEQGTSMMNIDSSGPIITVRCVHLCEDGHLGIADLIGAKLDSPVPRVNTPG